MAGVSEMPEHDHGHSHSHGYSHDDTDMNDQGRRREALAAFLAESAFSEKLRSVHIVTDDGDVNASFGQREDPSIPRMCSGVDSFMRNDPMAQSQYTQGTSFNGAQPPHEPSQGQYTQFNPSQRGGWPGVSQESRRPPLHYHTCAQTQQPPQAGFQSTQGSYGHPQGFGQQFTGQSGQSQMPQPPHMPQMPQMPQQPQAPFGSFQQTQNSFGAPPGGQLGTNTTGATCCSVGGGFCGQQHTSQGPPPGPGGPGSGTYAFAPGFNTSSMSGQASTGAPEGWAQGPAAPQGWTPGYIPPSSFSEDPARASLRLFCEDRGISREMIVATLNSGHYPCGDPQCGCDDCQFKTSVGVATTLVKERLDLLRAIHRDPRKLRFHG